MCIYIYIYVYIYICMCVCVCFSLLVVYVYIYIYIYIEKILNEIRPTEWNEYLFVARNVLISDRQQTFEYYIVV